MTENSFESSSIIVKFPLHRNSSPKSIKNWLAAKRENDNAEGLWRINDKLYDLINFVRRHPGGADWLELTQGTDITELFETHHIAGKAELLLPNFYVRQAKKPRNYRLTFCDDGFYKTLKTKVAAQLSVMNKRVGNTSNKIADALLVATIFSIMLTAKFNSISCSIFAGIFLNFLGIASHNFLHRRDNWRMYLLNLTGFNYREWRVAHAMSHHMYPNTFLDLEVSSTEPMLQWMPGDESKVQKAASVILCPLVWLLLGHVSIFKRTISYFSAKSAFKLDHLISFFVPFLIYLFGSTNIIMTLKLWLMIITVSGLFIGFINTTSGHHHPKIYHEGDELPKSMDFGIVQMNAVINRNDIKESHFLSLTLFGHHTLHHMFPTLDHALFPQLNELFLNTCREFEIQLRELSWWPLIVGQFQQLQRTKCQSLREMRI